MDQNIKKGKVLRSHRVTKPTTKKKEKKAQTKSVVTESKIKKTKLLEVSVTAEQSKEKKTGDATSIEVIDTNPKESLLSSSSGKIVCKKQATKTTRKLGRFSIDCDEITGCHKIDLDSFKSFLRQNIKVDGKKNDERVNIDRQNMQILISAEIFVEQKGIKFLIKKYLKKAKLHNWIKIENGKKMYKLKYFTM